MLADPLIEPVWHFIRIRFAFYSNQFLIEFESVFDEFESAKHTE